LPLVSPIDVVVHSVIFAHMIIEQAAAFRLQLRRDPEKEIPSLHASTRDGSLLRSINKGGALDGRGELVVNQSFLRHCVDERHAKTVIGPIGRRQPTGLRAWLGGKIGGGWDGGEINGGLARNWGDGGQGSAILEDRVRESRFLRRPGVRSDRGAET